MATLFGFEIKRSDNNKNLKSFVEPTRDDGALGIAEGGAYGMFLDMDVTAKSESELITRYRNMIMQPEVKKAVSDIVNEAVVVDYNNKVVECVTDDLNLSASIKKKIGEEFDYILKMLNFSNQAYEIFTRWYVDGRLYYHIVIDENNLKDGIKELRYVDPRKIKKIVEYENNKLVLNEPNYKKIKNEYFIYSENAFHQRNNKNNTNVFNQELKIAKDSVAYCTSGLMNEDNTIVLSYLHEAIKPLNQLRMMEDAIVIYRITRAPERRVFYIDVGNLPKQKAEQYIRDMMTKHKNRLTYNAETGEVKDDRRVMTMTDDFWLARREGGRGTEVTTLTGGENLSQIEDILYFQKRLFKSLNVPISRLESETGFSLGRVTEISRDEVAFSKFVKRLRARFAILFDVLLEKQLILKGIISPDEWEEISNVIRYDFQKDNYFEELKESEILTQRIQNLRDVSEFVGQYYSKEWVRKNILMMSDEDIEKMKEEIETEKKTEPDPLDDIED